MTVKEVAKLYRTNVATIRYLARRGRIKINTVEESIDYIRKWYDDFGMHRAVVHETCYREYIDPEEVERLDDMIYRYILDPFDDWDPSLTVMQSRRVYKLIQDYKRDHKDITLILLEDMRS